MKRFLTLFLALALILCAIPAMADAPADVFRFPEQVTLKVSIFDRGATGQTAVDNNFWTQWIQQEFGDPRNIKMEWSVIPRSEEVAKLNMLMAAGEAADICFTYDEAVVSNFVQQGGLIEMTELLDKHGQNIKSYLGEDLLAYGRFEGGQYSLPAKRVVLADQGEFIREDWLEAMGMEMPKTKAELYDCLVAIRDQNPGKVEGVIPYAVNLDLVNHNIIKNSFIKEIHDERALATKPDILQDGYVDYVLFLNKLYNEGLLSPDFALDDSELNMKDVAAGKAAMYQANYDHPIRVSPGTLSALQAQTPGAKLSPLNCFESVVDGKYYHPSYAPNGIFVFMPVYARAPEAAMMYLDWLCNLDTLYFLQNGVEGETYDLNEDGIPVIKDVQGDKHFNSMQNLDYTLLTNGQEFKDPELRIKAQALSYQGYADLYDKIYEVGNENLLVTSFHFETIIPSSAQYQTSLNLLRREMLTKAVMAKPEDCLGIYEQLVKQYMAEGGQAIMDEKVAAWDKAHS